MLFQNFPSFERASIAYFIAGLLAVTFMGYRERFAEDALASFMRQVDDPMVALGPALQIIRGIVIGLVGLIVLLGRLGYLASIGILVVPA